MVKKMPTDAKPPSWPLLNVDAMYENGWLDNCKEEKAMFNFGIAYIAKPAMQPSWLRIDWGKSGADWTPECKSTFVYLQPDGTWNTQPFRGNW